MKVLDLFSGIGGFSLGLQRAGMETVAFCEIDPFCRQVLKKHWANTKIHNDIRLLNGTEYRGTVDVVCGGFPCQPFSIAGKRSGKEDVRDLWKEMFRIIKNCKPKWVIGENVTGIIDMELDRCINDLESNGYTCETFIIPACAIGSFQRRSRCWIIAYNNSKRIKRNFKITLPGKQILSWGENVRRAEDLPNRSDLYESKLCRSANGISKRLDALGNAVVPQIPEIIGNIIMAIENDRI